VVISMLIHNLKSSVVAGKGILSSAIATGVFGFVTTILFLFCTPDLNTVFALDAPQPFVQIYALALGNGGCVVMTIIAVIGLILVCPCSLGTSV
jgi:translation initiation factor 5B